MPERIYNAAELITHDNYSTSTGGATKTLPSRCSSILIQNMDATDNILVSFDGSKYKTILPLASLTLNIDFPGGATGVTYKVKSSANTPAAECLYGSEA